MKMLFKIVSVTLAISVTMLFFSSYKKTEAAAAVTGLSTAAAVIGSLIVGVATYFGIEGIPDIQSYVKSILWNASITTDEEGKAIFNSSSGLPATVNPNIFNALTKEAVEAHNKRLYLYTHNSSSGGEHGGGGKNRIPTEEYNKALSAAITGIIASGLLSDSSSDDNPGSSPSGSVSGISIGISNVNGKPQKVTTTYTPTKVEIFDYLELQYTTFNRITDFELSFTALNASKNRGYYLPYFILNNTLYVPVVASSPEALSTAASPNSFNFAYKSAIPYYYFQGFTPNSLLSNLALVYPDKGDASCGSVSFAEVGNSLCVASYYYNANSGRSPSQYQYIIGFPDEPTSYPILFDTPSDSYTGKLSSTSTNYGTSNTYIFFVNAADRSDYFYGDVAISLDVDCAGYFKSSSSSIFDFSSTIGTAGKMLSGTEGSAVTGGEKTTYSELSDIEKAIYALAQQQGITYEEMLKQCNIMINENGEMYLESLDGVTHSIESLLSEFEKLLEQGDITNENIAASIEQLKAILEYLKSLNIEGLGSYMQELEATLDGLKQGDEEREAILGDISGQLTDMKEYLDSLGLSDVASDIKNISQILSDAASKELYVTEIESIDPDWYIEKFPFCLPFDFYRIITLFVRDPVPPVFTVPIQAEFTAFGLDQSVDEEIVLDLTVFKINGVDIVQVVLNFVCILGFLLMLIHNTTKFFV